MQPISGTSSAQLAGTIQRIERTGRTGDEQTVREKTPGAQRAAEYSHETPESPGRYWVKPAQGGPEIAFSYGPRVYHDGWLFENPHRQ